MFEPIEPTTEPSIPEDGHPAGVDSSTGDRKLLRPHRRGGKDRFEFLLKQTESISAKNVNESRTRGDVTKEVFRFETTPAYIQNGEMRDYQLRGLNWMISLYENNINGILADEMGLGKTLQTISLLGYLKHFKSLSGPFIVIVPKSTLQNWINEFTKWCPTLATFCLIGDAKTRSRIIHDVMAAGKWDVCVTSYEMCLCEQAALQKIDWRYMVIDEAHRIKNEKTKLATVLREFKTANRLLLTGTPLQNNLHELWALLNFLLPDVFDSSEDFDEWFNTNTCLGSDALMKRLHTVLAPFLLRRVKSDVESSLKAKNEINIFVGLSPMQHDLYKRILKKNLVILGTKMRVEFVLMHLRKCTNHPYLFEGVEPGPPYTTDTHIILNSGKLLILDKLLAKLKAQGSRVLIFSQMKAMLDILVDYCEWRNYEYCRLDGDTKHEYRDSQIQVFNKENSTKFIFMLTTRAGGVGINLATADVVIIYDSDWNPQMDLQAMDRAHRIGQQKQVRVFRLITENTVEEKIAECAEIKMRLDKLVLQKDCSELKLNRDQMRNIIRFGADSILAAQDSPTLNDEDIDTILERGLTKTIEQRSKLDQMAKESLRSLILDAHSHTTDATGGAGKSLYQFDGTDYGMKKLLEDHPQEDILETSLRQRRSARVSRSSSDQSVFHDFQFMPPRLIELLTKEREQGATTPLTDKEQLEKHELLQTAFPTWTKKDFSQFIQALREYARDDLPNIVQSVDNKTPEEVRAYYEVFWAQIHQVRNYTQIIKSFDRRSIKVAREEACEKLLRSLDGDVAIVNDRSVHHLTASPKFIRRGKLLDFQLEGLNWMISRFENGLNVLLADEMGLGKTLQAIALMGYYKNVMKIVEPYILIVPDTLTKQWKDEINRWCPSLRTMSIFNDTNNVDLENLRRTAGNNWDVCLTTLRVLNTKVGSVLTKINWYLMIIDEVHILKYNGHKFMRLFSKMLAGQRLLLSGAPMQRSFYELWIIIDLLLPNLFPTESKLKVWLKENNNFTSDKEMSDYLQTMTKAMVLRRTKLDVAEELMPKEDIILPVTLTNVQQELYVKAVQKHCTGLKDVNDMTKTSLQSKFDALFNIIDHPFLVEDYDSRYISRIVPSAGKIGQLDELLPALKKEGSRVLISTQSYKVLDILQHYCQWRNFKTTNLQEHTDDPYQAVCKLNSPNDKTFVVLFHARSDCIWGMNLPTVDVVIFYDANWNPFVNMQIVDRVHRIGQTKPVRVYHLVTKGTIEEDYVERVNSAQARSYNYQINKTEMWKILSNAGAELDGSLEATEEADLVGGKRKRRVSLALNPAKRMK